MDKSQFSLSLTALRLRTGCVRAADCGVPGCLASCRTSRAAPPRRSCPAPRGCPVPDHSPVVPSRGCGCVQVELETGGNIRLEDGKPSDVWYSSCVDLVNSRFLAAEYGSRFEQISTSRLDPRFATGTPAAFTEFGELHHVDVLPAAGTLVLFDSVSLPHLVREVTSTRPSSICVPSSRE